MKKALIFMLALLVATQTALQPPQTAAAAALNSPMEAGLHLNPNLSAEQEASGLPAAQPEVQSTGSGTPSSNNLYPEDLDPPETCGVPLRSPFGKDVEIFLGPWASANGGYRIDQVPAWYDVETMAGAAPYSNITSVPLSAESIAAVWKQGNVGGELYYSVWDASLADGGSPGGWGTPTALAGLVPDGNHAVISRASNEIQVYARDGGKILYGTQPILGTSAPMTWYEIPGVANAASDPAVAMADPNHILVFYQGTDGGVWFTEWVGAWRRAPMLLAGIGKYTFLPFANKQVTGLTSSITRAAPSDLEPRAISAYTIVSELSAISRHDKHAAVFGVDGEGRLWVKEWTQVNASDWSDTRWVKLMEGVAVEKPSVVSRHVNQMGVAVRDSNGIPYYIEWTVAAGWKEPVPLNNVFASPLALSVTSLESMSVFGVAADGKVYEKAWNEDDSWGSWVAITGTGYTPDQILSAAMRRMDDVMVVGRTEVGEAFFRHRTSQDQPMQESGIVASGMKGYGRGQALPWVDGKAVWVTAHEDPALTFWQVEVYDPETQQTFSLDLTNHPYHDQDVLSMADGDLDLDGSDEIVLATYSPVAQRTVISVFDLTTSPGLGISLKDSNTFVDASALGDVSVTIGDLDTDGKHNEVILGIILANHTRLRVYQYLSETETLTYKNQWYEAHDITGSHELELTSGYVDSEICGDRQSLVMLDTTKYSADSLYHVDARVITYCIMPDTWALVDEYTFTKAFSQASEPAWEPYHSAVAAGDVNVDGFEEVVFSFADKIILIKDIYYGQLFEINLAAYWENRSLAMGDIDRDGKAEVLLSRETGGSAHIELFEITPQVDLMKTGESTLAGAGIGTVLTGDLDGDTYISDLAGCATFHEPIVVAVVNGAPVWYQDGAPLHATGGSYSVSKGGGSGSENGTTYNVGGELTLGFKHEFNVPVLAIKIGEVRASVKVDYMHSWGFDNTTEEVTVYGTGYGFDDGLGIVVYFDSIYACYYYDLYHPDYPGDKARAMTCRPVAIDIQTKSSLEYWHSDEWKGKAGASWVDVGHKSYNGQLTNDLGVAGNYSRSLPIDPNSLVYEWDEDKPLIIAYDPNPSIYNEWWVESEEMTSTLGFYENAGNITIGGGFDAGDFTMDAAVTGGMAGNHGTITSWTTSLAFGGLVYAFDVDRPSYSLVPYVYKATATTLAGTTYEYWAVDYYVPDIFPGLQSITLPAKVEPIPD